LVLASEELADATIGCAIHGTEHGSDHHTIEATSKSSVPAPKQEERLLFKNAPWKEIKGEIIDTLRDKPRGNTVQQKTDRLITAILEAIQALTPRAEPSPYAGLKATPLNPLAAQVEWVDHNPLNISA
jgi:hypothetical protein